MGNGNSRVVCPEDDERGGMVGKPFWRGGSWPEAQRASERECRQVERLGSPTPQPL